MKLAVKNRAQAFTLIELLVVLVTLVLVVAILLTPRTGRRATCCRISCVNNLKQAGLAFKTWTLDNNDRFPMQVSVRDGGTMELRKQRHHVSPLPGHVQRIEHSQN